MLFRLLRIIARVLAVLIIRLLMLLLRLLVPLLLRVLRWLLGIMRFSITAAVNNPGQFIDRLASEWTRGLLPWVSIDHLDNAYRLCRVLAVSLVILGWVVTMLFTGLILRIVFGYFI